MGRKAAAAAGGAAVLAVGVALAVLWLVADARAAERHLVSAERDAGAVVTAAAAGRMPSTVVLLRLQHEAEAARARTRGWRWWTAEHMPLLGATPRAIAAVATAAVDASRDVVPPLAALGRDAVRHPPLAGGRVNLVWLRTASEQLSAAARSAHRVARTVDHVRSAGVLGPVMRRVRVAQQRLDFLDERLTSAARMASVAGDLLGAHGERRYLVALQNNAEARGTGGLAGAYVVLEADQGVIRVVRSGADDDLEGARGPVASLGPDYAALYGDDPALWGNANESPVFATAARLWLADWHQVFGSGLDGAVATDPIALSRMLAVTGPVRLEPSGMRVTAGNVVSLTERDLYSTYAHDNAARKRVLLSLLQAVLDRVLHAPSGQARQVVAAAARAAGDGRLLVYSTRPVEEQALGGIGWTGDLGGPNQPFVRLTIDNGGGNKLDYYLRRRLTYRLGSCAHGIRATTVTAQLTNAVPDASLPQYVASRGDARGRPAAAPGSNRLLVYLHLTPGAGLESVELDGQRVAVHAGQEQGHPVVAAVVDLQRGQTRTLVLHLLEPALRATPVVQVQPLVQPQETVVVDDGCHAT